MIDSLDESTAPALDVATVESLSAAEEIKRGLARELHDTVTQTLTTMLLELEDIKRGPDGSQLGGRIDSVQASARQILNDLRAMLYELRDQAGVEAGFVDMVRAGILRRFELRTGTATRLKVSRAWPPRMTTLAAMHLCRILEEALLNAHHHGGARQVEVSLEADRDGEVGIRVSDDGRGIFILDSSGESGGLGVIGMRERAVLLGGRLSIRPRQGGGTVVHIALPRAAVVG